jgi:hypothetical protein
VRWGWEVADDFTIRGADDFLRLSKALKQAGRTELRKELHKGLKDGATPLTKKTQAAFAAGMPSRELAARAGKTKQLVQVRTGKDPGVRVVKQFGRRGAGMGASNARLANRTGEIRHPVFGNREVWRNTKTSARGWFDDTLRRHAPDVRPELERAMERVVQQIVNEAR